MAKNKPGKNKQSQVVRATDRGKDEIKKTVPAATSSADQSSRNIIVAAVVILLILAGVGFLVLGLAQTLLSREGEPTTVAEDQPGETGGTEEPSAGEANGEQPGTEEPADEQPTDEQPSGEGSTAGEQTDDEDNQGSVNGDAVSDVGRTSKYSATNTAYSRGTDYNFGQITGNSYVVKQGDTLWQIAEARYGSGYAWVDINNANGGFKNLRNGQPVLLPVGYNLTLPDLQ